MKISQRALSISTFLAMHYAEKARQIESSGEHIIKFNLGEPHYGPTQAVKSKMLEAIEQNKIDYTSSLGLMELRKAIASYYQLHHDISINWQRVVVTSGASAALMLVCAAILNEGDEVLMGEPSYPCNREFASAFGGNVKTIPTNASSNFHISADDLINTWSCNTTAVIIASPSNPTGTSIDFSELQRIHKICIEREAWLIVDEIYLDLELQLTRELTSALHISDKLIVINSFSKYFGLTGWRLGWCVVPEFLIEYTEKLSQNYYICPSTPAQYAAVECFSEASICESEERRIGLIENKNLVVKALKEMSLPLEVEPHAAFYVYINIASLHIDSEQFCDEALIHGKVALTPGNDFGMVDGHKYVRLSFATDKDSLKRGLDQLKAFVNSLKRG